MQLVLFIGIQATGKSTFYKERFYRTHVRVNYDMLKTHRRQDLLVSACLQGRTKFVVDNTNLTRQVRARFIGPAQEAGFEVTGFFFESRVADALRRNSGRPGAERVPYLGVLRAQRRLELPALAEGFDHLFLVRLDDESGFMVDPWPE